MADEEFYNIICDVFEGKETKDGHMDKIAKEKFEALIQPLMNYLLDGKMTPEVGNLFFQLHKVQEKYPDAKERLVQYYEKKQ